MGSSFKDALSEMCLGQEALACTAVDRRNLLRAVTHFLRAQAWDELHTVLDLARRTGDVRTVCEIERVTQEQNHPELYLEDFNGWLVNHGIKWFDLYEDEHLGIRFISDQDVAFFEHLMAERFASHQEFWNHVSVSLQEGASYSNQRRELLECLAQGQPPVIPFVPVDHEQIEESFFRYCEEYGIVVFKRYQEYNESLGQRSLVYLVLDSDGLLKVFKQLPSHDHNALTITKPSESDIYKSLPMDEHFPRFYGVVEISDQIRFMKTSVVFGQSLAELIQAGQRLSEQEAFHVIRELACALEILHERGIVYMDLRPENVKVNGEDVVLLDFGDARFVHEQTGIVDTYFSDVRYAAPEVTLSCHATRASDIFQLGILFHLLLTGEHPFVKGERGNSRQEEVIFQALPNALKPYQEEGPHPLIARMLEKDPAKRPTDREVAEILKGLPVAIRHSPRGGDRPRSKNMVLFPARMGIPHKGHIEFMARILELGYHLKISLQCSYVISGIDPIPKWVVMKMVAQALYEKGFGPGDFHFIFTPLPQTDEEHRLWFALMDDWTDVVAIASGNPEVHELFAHSRKAFIDQRMLFGVEQEDYQDRSWGEFLRRAVREQDQQLFGQYIACGSQRVASLEQLKSLYAANPICAKNGRVLTVLLSDMGEELARTSVLPILGPEQSLLRVLEYNGKQVSVMDPYAPESRVEIDGKRFSIRYERMEVCGEDQTSFFVLIHE